MFSSFKKKKYIFLSASTSVAAIVGSVVGSVGIAVVALLAVLVNIFFAVQDSSIGYLVSQ